MSADLLVALVLTESSSKSSQETWGLGPELLEHLLDEPMLLFSYTHGRDLCHGDGVDHDSRFPSPLLQPSRHEFAVLNRPKDVRVPEVLERPRN